MFTYIQNRLIDRAKYINPLLILAAFFITSPQASAQSIGTVYVGATAKDSVGKQLIFATKEAIRRSAGLTLADTEDESRIQVHFVTIDPDSPERGDRTIYSAVWTVKTLHATPVTMHLTHYVGLCGVSRVQSCAQDLLATTDEQMSKVRQWMKARLPN